jgi:hypothetical protein
VPYLNAALRHQKICSRPTLIKYFRHDVLRLAGYFASFCGASAMQARSGKRIRHRLNRGGDCQASTALWRIAIVRMATNQRSRYVSRRVAASLPSSRS